jgi:hypothetical protein
MYDSFPIQNDLKQGDDLLPPLSNFAPKTDEVTRGWRKMHNEQIHNLYPRQVELELSSKGGLGGRFM